MKVLEKGKNISGDLIYSILGIMLINGVIQLVLYPFLDKQMGETAFGDVLTLLSAVAIIGNTFGTAANYSRMVCRTKKQDSNGDYFIYLISVMVLTVPVSIGILLWMKSFSIVSSVLFFILIALTMLRYYSYVEFRLNLNYLKFLIFCALLATGYIVGLGTYLLTHSWMLTIILGELFAVAYVAITGTIFRKPLFRKSEFFTNNLKSFLFLSISELIMTLILHSDRIILQSYSGGYVVTVFYAATLIGKMVSLVSTPMNGVLIGYLARYKGQLKPSFFIKLCGIGFLLSLIMDVGCVLASHIFVKIMYPDIYQSVVPYLWMANWGQILYFISSPLNIVLLRFIGEKYNLLINAVYFIIFLAVVIPMTALYGLKGMANAIVIVNVLRMIIISIVGYLRLHKNQSMNVMEREVD